jgi:threonine aldolase
MVGRLGEDHENARLLAGKLAEIDGISIDPQKVRTNILFITVTRPGMTAYQLSAALKERGVLANAVDENRIRMLTHHDVSKEDCLTAAQVVGSGDRASGGAAHRRGGGR